MTYYSWTQYAIFSVVYTFLVFYRRVPKFGSSMSPEQDARVLRPFPVLFTCHIGFLVLLGLLVLATNFVAHLLPDWITQPRPGAGRRGTLLDCIFAFCAFVLGFVEHFWVYVGPTKSAARSEDGSQ
jgi:hypothetical protein